MTTGFFLNHERPNRLWTALPSLNVEQAADLVGYLIGPACFTRCCSSPLAPHNPILVTSGKMAPELGDMPAGARF